MATTRDRTSRSKNLVGFVVGGVRYAVDILRVREILNPLAVVDIPHAPPAIVGVADHRGEVVPVLDVRARFGLPQQEATRQTKWIIVRSDGRGVALIVDAVTDVFGAEPGEHREIPQLGEGDEARGIAAVYKHDGGLVFVVDIDQVASSAETVDTAHLQQMVVDAAEGV